MKNRDFAIKCWGIENSDSITICRLIRMFSGHTSKYTKQLRIKNHEHIKKRSANWKRLDYKKFPDKHKKWARQFYYNNLDKERARSNIVMKNYYKLQYRKTKTEVLMYYGNGKLVCVCCGEKELKFLTLDHIIPFNKKEGRIRKLSGFSLYRNLKLNNFPSGFRTLCFNCNSGRALNNGICPHEEKRKAEIQRPYHLKWSGEIDGVVLK